MSLANMMPLEDLFRELDEIDAAERGETVGGGYDSYDPAFEAMLRERRRIELEADPEASERALGADWRAFTW